MLKILGIFMLCIVGFVVATLVLAWFGYAIGQGVGSGLKDEWNKQKQGK